MMVCDEPIVAQDFINADKPSVISNIGAGNFIIPSDLQFESVIFLGEIYHGYGQICYCRFFISTKKRRTM